MVTVCNCVYVCVCARARMREFTWMGQRYIETGRQRERDGVDGDEGGRRGTTGWGQGD